MTPRENVLRATRRQNPRGVPLDFGISREALAMFRQHLGKDVDVLSHFKFDSRWFGPSAGTHRPTPDWRTRCYADGSLPENAVINPENGWLIDSSRLNSLWPLRHGSPQDCGWRSQSATHYPEWGGAQAYYPATDDARTFHPLRHIGAVADLDAYLWPPNVGALERFAGVAERVRAAQAEGLAAVGGNLDFFEHPWALTGFEVMLMAMAADEPWARKLFARHAQDLLRTAESLAGLGVDVLQTGSDVATQQAPLLSPAMWRDWLFPLMRDAIAAARRVRPDILVLYHSDGNVEPLIEGVIKAGVDILNPIQPECMDIFALKDRYGDRLSFHGDIGVQRVMPFGAPRDVRDTVRRTIDYMSARGGGYLCSTAHMIRPDVPWENVMALVETVREYGHP